MKVYKDFEYRSVIAELADGIIIEAGQLDPGTIEVISVTPKEKGVQVVTDYTVIFKTEHTLYAPAGIEIEFPTKIILPATGTEVKLTPKGDNRKLIISRTGTIIAGNKVKIENIFAGENPPVGAMTIELVIEGIQNPFSSQPAGNAIISTLYETDTVDEGESDGTFTPVSGLISGQPVKVLNPITSGIDSVYDLIFVPESSIPKNGFILIDVPEELALRPSEVMSGGVCTKKTLTCTKVED